MRHSRDRGTPVCGVVDFLCQDDYGWSIEGVRKLLDTKQKIIVRIKTRRANVFENEGHVIVDRKGVGIGSATEDLPLFDRSAPPTKRNTQLRHPSGRQGTTSG